MPTVTQYECTPSDMRASPRMDVPDVPATASPKLQYSISDNPPWYLCLILGFQHYLTMLGSTVSIAFVLAPALCVGTSVVAAAEIISTLFFVTGIATFLQSTVGTRLPIVQGGSFAFLVPALAILSLDKWKCPTHGGGGSLFNNTGNSTSRSNDLNMTSSADGLVDPSGEEMTWMTRMRELQGAIILASLFEVAIGLFGLVGVLLRFIGPLTIAPTITLIGVSLYGTASSYCSANWWIALLTIFLIALFSQYLRNVTVPCIGFKYGRFRLVDLRLFQLFPVVLSLSISWFLCFVLTFTDVIPNDVTHWAYKTRTDINTDVLQEAAWFRVPYPLQWGMPTFSAASVFGMLSGVLAGMVESIGDYYACARLAGAPPPPINVINRGIFVEGVGCVIAGLFGTGTGSTSYSENIGAIGITQVGSRRVIQVAAGIILLLGMLGKFGGLFVTIPAPVIGGIFMVMFGVIAAVGISNLQFVDLNSPRNLFVFGVPLLLGLALPQWIDANSSSLNTGVSILDQTFTVLAKTPMFVGGSIAMLLDNTIPGTDKERGMTVWRKNLASERDGRFNPGGDHGSGPTDSTYDIPFCMEQIRRCKVSRFLPICPTFHGFRLLCQCRSKIERNGGVADTEVAVPAAMDEFPAAPTRIQVNGSSAAKCRHCSGGEFTAL